MLPEQLDEVAYAGSVSTTNVVYPRRVEEPADTNARGTPATMKSSRAWRPAGFRTPALRRSPCPRRACSREERRGGGADRAHGKKKKNRPGLNPAARPPDAAWACPKYDVVSGIVVRQHADDDRAVEQFGDIRGGLETSAKTPIRFGLRTMQ